MSEAKPIVMTVEKAQELADMMRQWRGMDPRVFVKHPDGVTIFFPQSQPPQPSSDSETLFRVTITSALTCGGCYTGKLFRQTSTSFASGNATFDSTDLGSADTDNITIINLAEIEASSHALTAGSPPTWVLWARRTSMTDADQGNRPVYEIQQIGIGC